MVLDQIHRQFRSASHQIITVFILDILYRRLRRMLHFHLSKDLRQTFVSVRRPPFHIQLHLLQLQRVKSVHRKARSEDIHKTEKDQSSPSKFGPFSPNARTFLGILKEKKNSSIKRSFIYVPRDSSRSTNFNVTSPCLLGTQELAGACLHDITRKHAWT